MTDRYAVFGDPVEHSLSPQIHAAFALQTAQDLSYGRQRVEPGRFAGAVAEFFAGGGSGLNVTLPHKIAALTCADELTGRARRAGAVNTLIALADRRLLGDNTDGAGLVNDLTRNLRWPLQGKRLLILGAGGAVRGVLGPLLHERPRAVTIANRTPDRARVLAAAFQGDGEIVHCAYPALAGQRFDLIINGTSASLSGALPALPEGLLAADAGCYDMMYAARDTVFLTWGRAQGAARLADGLGMLVEQAAEAFRQWRGVAPDTAPVIAALRAELARRAGGGQ